MTWFSSPDLAGGWATQHENAVGNEMQLDNQGANFFTHPLPYGTKSLLQQYWPLGLFPIGGAYPVSTLTFTQPTGALLGTKPYDPSTEIGVTDDTGTIGITDDTGTIGVEP